ncbi:MAG: DUF3226 domain-containing protein [Syntrophobacteraceae bacterium]
MAKKILLVEGIDDEHVLKHLCGNRGVPHLDDIKQYEGVDNLLESLPVRLKAAEFGDIIGVVIDADTDIASRWQSMRDRLSGVGYETVPNLPAHCGTILDPPADKLLPRVGIWIMPDNRSEGILEDFLRFLVPEGSKLFDHVESSVEAIPEGEKLFGPLAVSKAVIHTWLAWQQEPGKPLGTAITARYLDSGVPEVDILVSWLNRLFFS